MPEPGNPQAYNRYSYVLNNPVRHTDPSGHYLFEEDPSDPWIFSDARSRSKNYWTHPEGGTLSSPSDVEVIAAITSPIWMAAAVVGGIAVSEAVVAGGVAVGQLVSSLFAGASLDGDPTNELSAIYDSLSVDGDPSNEIRTGVNVVYRYVRDGVTKYVGITNDVLRRGREHAANRGWIIRPIEGLENLSRYDARAVEQYLIEHYSIDNLENMINSISPSNPIYQEAVQRGREILEQIGFFCAIDGRTMSGKRLYVGDIFSIPLPDGRTAYGQYLFRDKKWGYLVHVFDLFSTREEQDCVIVNHLKGAGVLIGPVLVGFGDVIRSGKWRILGRLPVVDFQYPGFLNVLEDNYKPRGQWSFWDGKTKHILGRVLPREYSEVELLIIWDPRALVERIVTGQNPYGAMVRNAAVG